MNVGEQCMYLAQLKGLSAREAQSRLKAWFERFEIGGWWDKKVEDLSKGMAQKVQFITTVLHKPKLLILDEPFSGFDPINAELIRLEMLRLKAEGTTIILSTHDMGSVESLCDNIALINRSRVILEGSVKDIKSRFRTQSYRVDFEGAAVDIGIGLWSQFELLRTSADEKGSFAEIKLLNNRSLNDLLQALIPHVQIHGVNEMVPDMEQIFIQAVQQFNATHE
jgi:ABC-2 type transport system ATP-binding protein